MFHKWFLLWSVSMCRQAELKASSVAYGFKCVCVCVCVFVCANTLFNLQAVCSVVGGTGLVPKSIDFITGYVNFE